VTNDVARGGGDASAERVETKRNETAETSKRTMVYNYCRLRMVLRALATW